MQKKIAHTEILGSLNFQYLTTRLKVSDSKVFLFKSTLKAFDEKQAK